MEKLDILKDWLRDAYAMEEQSIQVLRRHAERNENYPEMAARVRQHMQESERQAENIRQCLKRLQEDTSAIKTGAAMIVGNIQAFSGMIASDEIVKNIMFFYMHEHYEIGAYKVLIAAAKACGQHEIAALCESNLREEEAMQQWFLEHIDEITNQYLMREAAELETAEP